MNDQSFSIIVPTYRRPEALRMNLRALRFLEHPAKCEVIVVDNAGDNDTEAAVKSAQRACGDIRYERFTGGGAAAARNRGAGLAGGRWLLFCDDDILPVQGDHLARHLKVHEAYPRALVAGSWSFLPSVERTLRSTSIGRFRLQLEKRFKEEVVARRLESERFELDLASSCDLSVERCLFNEIGGFDADFPFAGAEDQDLSLRARQRGCRLVFDRSIRLYHNDRRLSLSTLCSREEQSARTAVVLTRKFPSEAGSRPLVTENGPVALEDRPALVAKKLIKSSLTNRVFLTLLHRLVVLAERLGTPDWLLHRLYRDMVGLHIFRGVRTQLNWRSVQMNWRNVRD